jgi:hypothetical protein
MTANQHHDTTTRHWYSFNSHLYTEMTTLKTGLDDIPRDIPDSAPSEPPAGKGSEMVGWQKRGSKPERAPEKLQLLATCSLTSGGKMMLTCSISQIGRYRVWIIRNMINPYLRYVSVKNMQNRIQIFHGQAGNEQKINNFQKQT